MSKSRKEARTAQGADEASDPTGAPELPEVANTKLAAPDGVRALPKFKPVPIEESPWQRGMWRPKAVGDAFAGWFNRPISRNDPNETLDFDALEFLSFPDKRPVLLPAHRQLWEFFVNIIAEDAERKQKCFFVQVTEVVPGKDGDERASFYRYDIGEEETEQ